jgi:cell division protein FtsB
MRKVLADMHVAARSSRWTKHVIFALLTLLFVGYFPSQILASDPKLAGLQRQLHSLEGEITQLERDNANKSGQVEALRTSVLAIEKRARNDLGMVYPGETVIKLLRTPPAGTAGAQAAPGEIPR